jgi:hypothetical protein
VLVSDKIIAALKDSDKPLNTVQICERTGVSIPQTYLPLFRLRQAGTITRERNEVGHLVYAIDNSVINSLPEYKLEQPPAAVTPKPKKKVGRPKGSAGKPKMTPEQTNHLLSIVSENIQKHGVVKKWVSEEEHTQVKKRMEAYEKQWLDALAVIDYLERKKV